MKSLRKGRGLFASHIAERVGPALRDVCDVTDEDGPAAIRTKVGERLEELADDLPADLRVAVLAAFAIVPDARLPLYQDRVSWAATRLNRDPRTARRRVDDGIDHLARLAAPASTGTARATPVSAAETGWHTTQLRATLALDRARPEIIEQRRIVSNQDDLTELDLAITVAVPGEPTGLEASVLYGGTLAERGMESSDRYAFALALPAPLARGATHDFALQFRFPEDEPMRPHFVCVPKRRCTLFDLRIRYGRNQVPERIWRLDSAFQRDIYDPVPTGAPQSADPAGEIHLTFRDLMPGLAYGARWA